MNKTSQTKRKIPEKIRSYLDQGEGVNLDFKNQVTNESKIARTLSAFANTKGGILLIGVNDNKTIGGVNAEEEKFMISKIAEAYCHPAPDISFTEWPIGKKVLLEVQIKEGTNKPYYARDPDDRKWAYVRIKDETILASNVMLEVLKKRHHPEGSLIKFTSNEKILLDHLSEHSSITLDKFKSIAGLNRRQATAVLVNLITSGMLKVEYEDDSELYVLNPEYN